MNSFKLFKMVNSRSIKLLKALAIFELVTVILDLFVLGYVSSMVPGLSTLIGSFLNLNLLIVLGLAVYILSSNTGKKKRELLIRTLGLAEYRKVIIKVNNITMLFVLTYGTLVSTLLSLNYGTIIPIGPLDQGPKLMDCLIFSFAITYTLTIAFWCIAFVVHIYQEQIKHTNVRYETLLNKNKKIGSLLIDLVLLIVMYVSMSSISIKLGETTSSIYEIQSLTVVSSPIDYLIGMLTMGVIYYLLLNYYVNSNKQNVGL